MGFFDKLFGGKGTKSLPNRDDRAQSASPSVNPSARVRKPSTKGLSEEERRDATERYSAAMRAKFSASAERDRERSVALGVTHFRWVTVGDEDVCDDCRRNAGKRFAYKAVPNGGLPGQPHCPSGWCRCVAKPIVKGFS